VEQAKRTNIAGEFLITRSLPSVCEECAYPPHGWVMANAPYALPSGNSVAALRTMPVNRRANKCNRSRSCRSRTSNE